MKFICQCSVIRQEIEYSLSFCTQKNSLSIASTVLLENNGDTLTLKATDGKMSFISSIAVSTVVPGSTSVFCDKLVAVMKNMPDGNVEFSEDNGKLTIRPLGSGSNININLKTMDSTKFPPIQACPEEVFFSIPQRDYSEMIDKTAFAVCDDQTRYFLSGVYMENKGDKLVMVATDGRRLAYAGRTFEQEISSFRPVIIPVKFLHSFKAISSGEGVFSLGIENNTVYARIGNRTISSSLVSGSYPNYERVIPSNLRYECRVKTSEIEKSISLISVLIEAKSRKIYVDISREGIMISGENTDYGDSKQIIACAYEGEDAKICFNCDLLYPAVKKIDSEYMKISFTSTSSAMILSPDPAKDYFYVLMPMQS